MAGRTVIPPRWVSTVPTKCAIRAWRCQPGLPALRRFRLSLQPRRTRPRWNGPGKGTQFPTDYRDDLYVAFHGSWNTDGSSNRDCKVERIILENGIPAGSQDFANGWRAPGGKCGDAATWGRPADVAFGPQGDLYISDDKGLRIYRVIYAP